MTGRVEIEYELTRDDLFHFQWRAAVDAPAAKRYRRNANLTILAAFGLITVWSLTESWGTKYFWFNLGWWGFFLVLYIGLTKLFEGRLTRGLLNKLIDEEKPDAGRLGRHKIVLDENGVTEATAVGESLTRWAGVHKLQRDDSYIYIYTAPGAAHIVPRRAFASASEAAEFVKTVEQKMSERP